MYQIYGKEGCVLCSRMKMVFELCGEDFEYFQLGEVYTEEEFETKFPGKTLMPQVTKNGQYIGNGKETVAYLKENRVL